MHHRERPNVRQAFTVAPMVERFDQGQRMVCVDEMTKQLPRCAGIAKDQDIDCTDRASGCKSRPSRLLQNSSIR